MFLPSSLLNVLGKVKISCENLLLYSSMFSISCKSSYDDTTTKTKLVKSSQSLPKKKHRYRHRKYYGFYIYLINLLA